MDTHLVTHTLNRGERITKDRFVGDTESISLLIELVKRLDNKAVDGFTALYAEP